MAKNTSQHILNTSANLLGICLFVITSVHISNRAETSLVDDFTSLIAVLLSTSSVLSFLSIRSENMKSKDTMETIADYFFMIALVGVMLIILFIALKIIR